jgi:CDP-glucose 4,6-dehydratase
MAKGNGAMEGLALNNPLSRYQGRKVLVTGHTGFKGAWLCQWLKLLGADVSGIALNPPTEPNLYNDACLADLLSDDIRCDIRNREALIRCFQKCSPEVVFHLAAQPIVRRSYKEPVETFETNVLGTVNTLEAIRATPSVEQCVCITTDKCYKQDCQQRVFSEDDPLGGDDPYSASKACVELVCHSYFKSFFSKDRRIYSTTARAGNVIGGGDWAEDRLVPDIVRALKDGQPVKLRNPAYVRPWQHVLEALHGYLLLGAELMSRREDCEGAWNFGPNERSAKSVEDLTKTFVECWGEGTFALEDYAEGPEEARWLMLSSAKAKEFLLWDHVWGFEQTVRRTVEWYHAYLEGEDAQKLCDDQITMFMKSYAETRDNA